MADTSLAPQLMNGHDLECREWQERTDKYIRGRVYHLQFDSGTSARAWRPAQQQGDDQQQDDMEEQDVDTDDSGWKQRADDNKPRVTVVGIVPMGALRPADITIDYFLSDRAQMQLAPVPGDRASQALCVAVARESNSGTALVMGITAPLPLYEYRLTGIVGSNGRTLFNKECRMKPLPYTQARVDWFLEHVCGGVQFTCATVRAILGRAVEFNQGPRVLLEQLIEAAKREEAEFVSRQSKLLLQQRQRELWREQREQELRAIAEAPDATQEQKDALEMQRCTNALEEDEEKPAVERTKREQAALNFLIKVMRHGESVRYLGGPVYYRLMRYVPEDWLQSYMGFGDTPETRFPMDAFEQRLIQEPHASCFEHSRAYVNRDSQYKPYPVWSLAVLYQFVVDYSLPFPDDETLLCIVVWQLMRRLYTRSYHICVTMEMLERELLNWAHRELPELKKPAKETLWQGSGRFDTKDTDSSWFNAPCPMPQSCASAPLAVPEPVVNKYAAYVKPGSKYAQSAAASSGSGVQCNHSGRQVLSRTWLHTDTRTKLARALHRLSHMTLPTNSQERVIKDATGTLVLCHQVLTQEQVQHALLNAQPPAALKDLTVYLRDSYQTEAALLRVIDRLYLQGMRLAMRDGPLKLRKVPEGRLMCSEQLAFLNGSVGYRPDGNHHLPTDVLINVKGRAGAGKTECIPLLQCVLPDDDDLMVFSYQGSHLNVVARRFKNVRMATMMRALFMHEKLCNNYDGAKSEPRTPEEFARRAKERELHNKYVRRMANEQRKWNKNHAHLRDEQGRRVDPGKEPDCRNYGFPFTDCPWCQLKVVIFEEFGTAPWSLVCMMIGMLVHCCPNLRCIVTCGDPAQLPPISPGFLQRCFLAAFRTYTFEHPHRQGQGPMSGMATAIDSGQEHLIEFDGITLRHVECSEFDAARQLIAYHKKHNLTPYNSLVVTRTNRVRREVGPHLRRAMMQVPLSKGGAQDSMLRHGQKFYYKRNRPSMNVCNKGMYVCMCAMQVVLERVSDQESREDREREGRTHMRQLDQLNRDWAEESRMAASGQEFELACSRTMLDSGLPVQQVVADALQKIASADAHEQTPMLAVDSRVGAGNSTNVPDASSIPASVFAKRPSFDADEHPRVILPMSGLAVQILLQHQSGGKLPLDETIQQTRVRLVAAANTPQDLSHAVRGSMTVIAAIPYVDGMDPDAPFDRKELLLLPYTGAEKNMFEDATIGTIYATQGVQTSHLSLLQFTVCSYDTRNGAYSACTRPVIDPNEPNRPAFTLFGSLEAFKQSVRNQEPMRYSETSRLLTRLRDARRAPFDDPDYAASAELETREAGRFGRRSQPFVELYEKQKRAPKKPPISERTWAVPAPVVSDETNPVASLFDALLGIVTGQQKDDRASAIDDDDDWDDASMQALDGIVERAEKRKREHAEEEQPDSKYATYHLDVQEFLEPMEVQDTCVGHAPVL